MKSLFVDCNHQLAPVFARVHRPDDPPITVNTKPFVSEDLPGLLDGYGICSTTIPTCRRRWSRNAAA